MIGNLFIYIHVLIYVAFGQQGQGQGQGQFNPQAGQGQGQGQQGQFNPPPSGQGPFVPQQQQSSGQFGGPQAGQFGQQPVPGQGQQQQGQFGNQQPQGGQFGQPNPGQQQNFGGPQQQGVNPFGPSQTGGNPLLGAGGQQPIPGIGGQPQPNFGGNVPPGGNVPTAGAPQVTLTSDLLPIDRAQPMQQIVWQEGEMVQIYCVSQPPAQEMRFSCPDCNTTGLHPQYFDQVLAAHTQSLNEIAGFPSIKLSRLPMNGEMFDRKTLRCEAYYQGATSAGQIGRLNVTRDVVMNVMYLSSPRIVDNYGHNPIATQTGNRFYVSQAGMSLFCHALGNPAPVAYQWFVNGVYAGQQSSIPVSQAMNNNAISCKATNAQVQQQQQGQQGQQQIPASAWKESAVVMIGSLMGPAITATTFEDVKKTAFNDAVNGKIALGKSVQLQCTGAGAPKPYIQWMQQSAPGRIINATCNGGARIVNEVADTTNPQNAGVYYVTGQCGVNLDMLEKGGDYFCSACTFAAENYSVCVPPLTALPQQSINFDLTGPPVISPLFRMEKTPNSDRVTFYHTYCADPPPQSNEVYWTIGNDRLNLNNRLSGVQAGPYQPNGTFADCYDVSLLFDSASTISRSQYVLHVAPANSQQTQQSFPLGDFMAAAIAHNSSGSNSSPYVGGSVDQVGLAVGIAVGVFVLVMIILLAFLWYKQKACFAPNKARTTTTTTTAGKPKPKPVGGSGGKYVSNLPPSSQGGRAEPLPEKMPPLTRPNPDGYPSERTNIHSTNGYSPKRTHEGLTYSEFDLVKDSTRPPPPGSRPIEYTRLQPAPPPTHLKSPTNSTV